MCTYATERIAVTGSAKGAQGWFRATTASVYYDHPVHALAGHSLNIDVLSPDDGPSARVALELTAESARALAAAIEAALAAVPVELLE
jgi:2-phospho-L-lactate guanylyltransferase (CobY/MobA/RfbA family)